VRELLSFLPSNNLDDPPRKATQDDSARADASLDTIVPTESNQPYDMVDVIARVVDDGYSFRYRSTLRGTSWWGLLAWPAVQLGLWPTSPRSWLGCSILMPALKGARFVRFL